MSLRLAIFLCLTPILVVVILVRPFWGTIVLSFFYFVRPELWDVGGIFRPILIYSLACGAALLVRFRQIRITLSFVLALGMLGMMFLSSFGAAASEKVSFNHNIVVLKMIIAMLFIINFLRTQKEMDLFLWSFVVGVAWMNKAAIYNYVVTGAERVSGVGGQGGEANYLAMCITMTFPFLVTKCFSKRRVIKVTGIALIPVWLGVLVLTGSRAGFLALVLTLVLLLLKARKKLLMIALAVFMIVLFIILSPNYYWNRMNTVIEYHNEPSALSRIELWDAALRMFKDHPTTGIGQDNFILLSPKYAPDLRSRSSESGGYVAHNTFLQLLVEGGIQSLAFLLLLLFVSLRYVQKIRALPVSNLDGQALYEHSTSIELGLLAFIVNALFGSYIQVDLLYWYLGCAGALHLMSKTQRSEILAVEQVAAA